MQVPTRAMSSQTVTITVGGGKGGVGKSTITSYVGAMLSEQGFSVGFIDADLGGPNLHTCLGVKRPRKGLQDFLFGRAASLSDAALPVGTGGAWLVGSCGDGSEAANLAFAQKQRLIAGIRKAEADYILVDLGAGSGAAVTDFFAAFPLSIVVTDGLPASIENAYSFLKGGVARGLCRLFPGRDDLHALVHRFSSPLAKRPLATIGELVQETARRHPAEAEAMRRWLFSRKTFLVVNMVRSKEEIERARRLSPIVNKYLCIGFIYIGYVVSASALHDAFRLSEAPSFERLPALARECFAAIARNLIALTKGQTPHGIPELLEAERKAV